MKRFFRFVNGFFFARMSANGWGLMRIAWAAVVLVSNLLRWSDIVRNFSNAGFLPPMLAKIFLRDAYRFSIFTWVSSPDAVFALYLILLIACVCVIVGLRTRLALIVSVLLLFSFHERNPYTLAGGETVLRFVGFLLLIAPGSIAFSLDRTFGHWKEWKLRQRLLPPLTMPMWPWRLLVWQFIVIYITSGWDKLFGSMWWKQGTAVASVLHDRDFTRFGGPIVSFISVHSMFFSRLTIIWEFTWLLVLIPAFLWRRVGLNYDSIKRFVIVGGILFHGSILVIMDAGWFSPALFAAYLGLLNDDDFRFARAVLNRLWRGTVVVLYDGLCGLCRKSLFFVLLLDHLHRVKAVNFHDKSGRANFAPDISLADLDRALHMRFVNKDQPVTASRTLNGFDAFRALAWHLPALWIFVPFLYFPGARPVGRYVYTMIANSRSRGAHDHCLIG